MLVDEYYLWVRSLDPVIGSKLEDAVNYALNQEQYLRAFLKNGEVEISNNFAENAIRPFVIGRKNWLFSDTVKGAKSSAIIYSLIETAKANGIEPYTYLNLILTDMQCNRQINHRIALHPENVRKYKQKRNRSTTTPLSKLKKS